MAAIKSKDTRPERTLRHALRTAGATGYRLHRKDLPGRPDIAFVRWRVAVFVDGVFWHGHPDHWNPERASSPYWREKILRNKRRDEAVNDELSSRGWLVLRFWDKDVISDPEAIAALTITALKQRGWSNRQVKD